MLKKVLIFSTAYFPLVGGAEVAVKEITDRVADFEFDMITVRLNRNDKRKEKIGQVTVYRIGWGAGRIDKLLFPFRAAHLADRLHQRNNYAFSWSIMASFSGFAALFFKKKNPGVKFLLTLQEGDDLAEVERKTGIFRKWFKEIFSQADYIQVISNYLAAWARKMGSKGPIEAVPNGVDFFKFSVSDFQYSNRDIKNRLNIKEGQKIIITASRLVKKNAIDDVIEALKYLPDNFIFLVLGQGEDRNKLEKLAQKIGAEERVKFLGRIDHRELPSYLHSADVFVRPSLSEGLGNSFLEAMAAGLPVIATGVGGIPDFLKDGQTGLFCEVNNPRDISQKIKMLINNDELRKHIIKNGQELTKEKYDWRLIAERMGNIFNKLK